MRKGALIGAGLAAVVALALFPLVTGAEEARELRWLRFVNCFSAGAALSISGLIFQSISRNPLADPYLSGTAPAALLGYLTGMLVAGGSGTGELWAIGFSVLTGLAVALVSFLTSKNGRLTMLLFGILIGSVSVSLTNLLTYYFPERAVLQKLASFSISSLDLPDSGFGLWALGGAAVAGAALDLLFRPQMLALTLTGDKAASLGASARSWLLILVLTASILTSLVTVSYGLVGFIGFVVPNVLRRVAGVSFRFLFLSSVVLGGLGVAAADGLGRLLVPPYGVPAGILTSLLGAPFLLFVLLRRGSARA